jgi:hypothetical protein
MNMDDDDDMWLVEGGPTGGGLAVARAGAAGLVGIARTVLPRLRTTVIRRRLLSRCRCAGPTLYSKSNLSGASGHDLVGYPIRSDSSERCNWSHSGDQTGWNAFGLAWLLTPWTLFISSRYCSLLVRYRSKPEAV